MAETAQPSAPDRVEWPVVDDALAPGAPLARRWAGLHCAADAAGASCAPYHGLWPYLRLMGLSAALGGHAQEYLRAMVELARQWHGQDRSAARSILISGCADQSMLAHVLAACKAAGVTPRVTVLDICPTPLKLAAWYAERHGTTITTCCDNLLAHDTTAAYDLIVTSSFLGYFAPDIRPRLFRHYAGLLRPGGQLMFSNRLRPGPETEPVGQSQAQASAFAERIAELSRSLAPELTFPPAEARDMALAYANRRRPYPLHSQDTILQLADQAGLRPLRCATVRTASSEHGVSGPTLRDGANYLFVILERSAAVGQTGGISPAAA